MYFEVHDAPSLDIRRLGYFAISVFWRSAVWPLSQPPRIQLGPKYSESLRAFQLDDGVPFPPDVWLKVVLCTPGAAQALAYVPIGGREPGREFYTYNFVIPAACLTSLLVSLYGSVRNLV
jgi:hypothetical protein